MTPEGRRLQIKLEDVTGRIDRIRSQPTTDDSRRRLRSLQILQRDLRTRILKAETAR